jgi:hypothetical protein
LIFQSANEILPIQQTNTEEWGRRGKKKHPKNNNKDKRANKITIRTDIKGENKKTMKQ